MRKSNNSLKFIAIPLEKCEQSFIFPQEKCKKTLYIPKEKCIFASEIAFVQR